MYTTFSFIHIYLPSHGNPTTLKCPSPNYHFSSDYLDLFHRCLQGTQLFTPSPVLSPPNYSPHTGGLSEIYVWSHHCLTFDSTALRIKDKILTIKRYILHDPVSVIATNSLNQLSILLDFYIQVVLSASNSSFSLQHFSSELQLIQVSAQMSPITFGILP